MGDVELDGFSIQNVTKVNTDSNWHDVNNLIGTCQMIK